MLCSECDGLCSRAADRLKASPSSCSQPTQQPSGDMSSSQMWWIQPRWLKRNCSGCPPAGLEGRRSGWWARGEAAALVRASPPVTSACKTGVQVSARRLMCYRQLCGQGWDPGFLLLPASLTPIFPFSPSRIFSISVMLSLGLLCNCFGRITWAVSPGRGWKLGPIGKCVWGALSNLTEKTIHLLGSKSGQWKGAQFEGFLAKLIEHICTDTCPSICHHDGCVSSAGSAGLRQAGTAARAPLPDMRRRFRLWPSPFGIGPSLSKTWVYFPGRGWMDSTRSPWSSWPRLQIFPQLSWEEEKYGIKSPADNGKTMQEGYDNSHRGSNWLIQISQGMGPITATIT